MKNLNDISGMPQMRRAFAGWTKQITLTRVAQKVVNGLVIDSTTQFSFKGTIQPLNPKAIMLKPEGQRAWTWLQIHVTSQYLAPSPATVIPRLWDTPGTSWDTPGATYDDSATPTFDEPGSQWDTPGQTFDSDGNAVATPTFDVPGETWDTPGRVFDQVITIPKIQPAWQNLNVNDLIYYNGDKYKIMAQNDYSLNGFIEYHAVKDYQP